MSEQYLLDCKCGQRTPVMASQAGREVRCTCGARLDVPPLRTLRRLPVAERTAEASPPAWTARQRLWVVGVLLIVAGAALGGYMRWNRPLAPHEKIKVEIDKRAAELRQETPKLDIIQARRLFDALSATPLNTLDELVEGHRYRGEYAELRAANENWTRVAWVLAGLGVVAIAASHVLAGVALNRRSAGDSPGKQLGKQSGKTPGKQPKPSRPIR